jgi:hypothetical protein
MARPATHIPASKRLGQMTANLETVDTTPGEDCSATDRSNRMINPA